MSSARRSNLLPPALIAVALLAGGLAAGILVAGLHKPKRAAAAPGLRADVLPGGLDGRPAPAFRLADARGGTVDTRALRGRPYALTFLYTHCPDVCPTLAADLRDAQARRPFTVVAVSVDPRGDTRGAVRAFAARLRLGPRFRYAIGSRPALRPSGAPTSRAPSSATRAPARTPPRSGSSTRRGACAGCTPAAPRSARPTSRTTCARWELPFGSTAHNPATAPVLAARGGPPLAYWWYVCGGRRPAAAGAARRNAA